MPRPSPNRSPSDTHRVDNQPEPLGHYNAYLSDPALIDAVQREGASGHSARLETYGDIAGERFESLGELANEHLPTLKTHDRYGHRIDQVEFHPAYHELMKLGLNHGLASLTWNGQPGDRVARSVLMYLHNQFEAGTMCPITMTHAALPALREQPELAAEWAPRILAGAYDPRFVPAEEKHGVTLGMAMTEKQGGSDVRANTTRARPLDGPGGGQAYELVGHKWFCSAPMSDAFLSLAQTDEGLSCFLVPRFRPDGSVNPIRIQRLKHKLGNRSNASSEIEYPGTWARCVGEPGRGVPTIIRMVAETRLDCAIGSAALMRQAVAQAIDHCRQRSAFGARLSEQPLMKNVLADLAIESEAAMRLALHLAGRFERSDSDEASERIARIATPIAKYWICKRAVHVINEAQECMGGAGYVEEFILPRLYREAPVNAIWEGSGNVQCLDVLRAVQRDPACLDALLAWLQPHASALSGLERCLDDSRRALLDGDAPGLARRAVEGLALAMQAVLLEGSESPASEAFAQSRLDSSHGMMLGTLPRQADLTALIERAAPRP
ncbi:acyl-CoA dehydrogenase family protein [Wenzhouxiangella marina]|uniref:Acyl-CoA dehydrogenase n=1 Tax=Wenzhouxiangella marina TaxID=1579979 RepID=A0A0K0XWR7_9GAMM|nr:acyl-CoA dehydrogenase family protein [Wenzhouxiangella marina]AKS42115.1 Acyl-CoA dehydrogenase [Wenzhouxiangella marina]MBB6086113.1 putative acyl-CoA dehydrogenase [Wenzhouxiangella marina]